VQLVLDLEQFAGSGRQWVRACNLITWLCFAHDQAFLQVVNAARGIFRTWLCVGNRLPLFMHHVHDIGHFRL
jgi:hypothetical protein